MVSRSPRWSSGHPRVLLALVLEFDSHRREISLNLQKCKKRINFGERLAAWVRTNRRESTREENAEFFSRKKKEGAYRGGDGGGGSAMRPRI